ncbi:hypothetical protein J5N97_019916 [Dioscorea zingiberensis]|uniref:NAC domain-containing protein n=1 Tax=Dioscorea zingiberensis TaxID=325984 RepID=A0A9D5HD62_9LILI|nr:hypothetical protein J5N97_019916 [Dioscorea zingiberensis]
MVRDRGLGELLRAPNPRRRLFLPNSIDDLDNFSPENMAPGRWNVSSCKKTIKEDGKIIGYKSSLVFEVSKKKENTGWIMQEYELPSPMDRANTIGCVWVICRIKRIKQLEKKRTRYNEDGVSIGDEEFSLLYSQGDSKKMAWHARGWEQESVEGVRFDIKSLLEEDEEIMCANSTAMN